MYNKPLTREHPLYNGQFLLVPMVSALERFHCSRVLLIGTWFGPDFQRFELAEFDSTSEYILTPTTCLECRPLFKLYRTTVLVGL